MKDISASHETRGYLDIHHNKKKTWNNVRKTSDIDKTIIIRQNVKVE